MTKKNNEDKSALDFLYGNKHRGMVELLENFGGR